MFSSEEAYLLFSLAEYIRELRGSFGMYKSVFAQKSALQFSSASSCFPNHWQLPRGQEHLFFCVTLPKSLLELPRQLDRKIGR